MTISAFLPVLNEEKRIDNALKSLMWCDEIILIDKESSDRTVEIAISYGAKIKVISQGNKLGVTEEIESFLNIATSEWVLIFTASDVIHPRLAFRIKEIISKKEFLSNVLHVPFKRYVLGVNSTRSPWHTYTNPVVIRKSAIQIDRNSIHGALQFHGPHYKLEFDDIACMYHLTHENVDIMMDRHIRYWRSEAMVEDLSLNRSLKAIFSGVFSLLFVRRTWSLGHDGLMLTFSYLSYLMMSYVYNWEKVRGTAGQVYLDIRQDINAEWDNLTDEGK